jgi:RHS repeat-associated protein
VEQTDALGKSATYQHDSLNRVTQITDRKGQSTRMAYSATGQLSHTTYSDGAVQALSYDAIGRISEVQEPASRWAYRYDRLDRIIQTTHTTAAGKVDIHYAYNRFDKVTARIIKRDGVTIETASYLYDQLDRVVGQRISPKAFPGVPDQITTWRYDSAGKVARRILPNGVRQLFAYDSAGRLSQIKYLKTDASLIEQIDYTYDALGQRISKSLLNGSGAPETPMSASYDSANRMTQVTLSTAGGTSTYSLTYDDNGNLVKKQNVTNAAETTSYSWDARNRLIGLIQSTGVGSALQASFAYDNGGRRISKTVTAGGNTDSVQYLYEGAQAVGEVRNGTLDASLLTGAGLDDVIARILSASSSQSSQPQVRTMITDALGSVIAQAKADQSVENGYAYSPYGETQKVGPEQGTSANSSQYTGRENDRTGLYYYRARYYDPVLKRFISRDPIGLAGGMNDFAYVGANPISRTDPKGLFWFQQPWQARDPVVGREGSPIEPGGPISSFIERYVPAGRTLGEIHDPLVDALTRAGVPDLLANVPTMLPAYTAATALEILRSLGLEKQPQPLSMCPRP